MKLGNLIALPFALIADAITMGEAGITHRILDDESHSREVEALKALAKIVESLPKKP